MNDNNVISLASPATDSLNEVLKQGAQQLLSQAIEAEVQSLLANFADLHVAGKQAVVRNGHLPERKVQTGLGEIAVKVPKVRDRSGQGIKFNSALIPPYLKRTKTLDEFIPWLYLKGISTGDIRSSYSHR
jgi:transposase-like protein